VKGPSRASPHFFERTSICNLSTPPELQDINYRVLQLTQIAGATLEVYVAKFKVEPLDKISRRERNNNGVEYVLDMPPYCLANLETIRGNMKSYIQKERPRYLETLCKNDPSGITALTAKAAIAYANKHPVSDPTKIIHMTVLTTAVLYGYCGARYVGLLSDRHSRHSQAFENGSGFEAGRRH
jgi:hypothetical protein